MTTPASDEAPQRGAGLNLALATWAFMISFWAWNLIAPLGARYAEDLGLTPGQKAMLVAIPVLVGAAGRIVAGILTDFYGGRVMFPVLLLLSVPFVLLLALAGNQNSYPMLIVVGFFLGIAGTTFAVGIPFVSSWYAPSRRGFATGVFGVGMGGTALSAFLTPRFVDWFGYTTTHVLIAVALAASAALVWQLMRTPPGWAPNREPVVPKLVAALKLPITWQMSFLYAVVFGGFVAFSTYLPTYLKDVYEFDLTGAGTHAAGFAVAAVAARPIGGILSDRVGAKPVVAVSLAGASVLAALVARQPQQELWAGGQFVALAMFLGLGTGGVFAWLSRATPPARAGTVAGLVGAAGGLGGFFPPLVMGATYDEANRDYSAGLLLLCAVAAIALVFTVFGIRSASRAPTANR